MRKKTKKPKKINPFAKNLSNPMFQQKVLNSKKKYNKKDRSYKKYELSE